MPIIPPVPSFFKEPVVKQFLEALRQGILTSTGGIISGSGYPDNIVCESIKVTDLAGNPDNLLTVDALGNVGVSSNSIGSINGSLQDLQNQIDNQNDLIDYNNTYLSEIRGVEDLSIGVQEIVITHGKTLISYAPTVSLIVPDTSVLFIAGIKDITPTTFTVVLSGEVYCLGYKVSWNISSSEIMPSFSFQDLNNTPDDISADNGKFLKVFDNQIVTSDISEIYYYNEKQLTINQSIHEITDAYVTSTSKIICNIKAPLESLVLNLNVIEVNNGSFKIELSGEVNTADYFICYSVFK